MERIILNSAQEVFEKILSLEGEETLFLNIDKGMANDLRYIRFKKDGLHNTVMSYINSTHEMANLINFEKFVDRVAQLTYDQNILQEKILMKYIGEKATRYILSNHSHHQFTIDTQNSVLSIQKNNTCTAQSHMGICTC